MKKAFKYIGLLFGLFVVYVMGTLTIDGVHYRRTFERCIQDFVALNSTPEAAENVCRGSRAQGHYSRF